MQNKFSTCLLLSVFIFCPFAHSQSLSQSDFGPYQQFDLSQISAPVATSFDSPASNMQGAASSFSSGATGDQSHMSGPTIQAQQSIAGTAASLPQAYSGNVAQGSVNSGAVPSGQFNFGFPQIAPSSNLGLALPPTSTSSCDFNIVDQ
jgi:hypothetical protein